MAPGDGVVFPGWLRLLSVLRRRFCELFFIHFLLFIVAPIVYVSFVLVVLGLCSIKCPF